MNSNLPLSLKMLYVSEGDYSNDAHDPGGPTNKGVIQSEYNAYRRSMNLPIQSVRLILDSEVVAIYKAQYWDRVQADALPSGIDYIVFDDAVNCGPRQAIIAMQRTLNSLHKAGLAVDGVLGLLTMEAVHEVDPTDFIKQYVVQRMGFYRHIPGWRWFASGWTHRIYGQRGDPGVLKNALSLVAKT
jgi:lysozyme family protein